MNHQEAIEKAVKLLRLATSSNPHEAALAASRAQEIIDRFNIEAASLALDGKASNESEPIRDFGSDPLEEKHSTWRWRFLATLVRMNGCKAYLESRHYKIIGRPSDVQTVRYFFAWLCREIDRLCAAECKGNGRVFINNWRIGCAETISERLRAQQKTTRQAMIKEIETGSLPLEYKNQALIRLQSAVSAVDKKLDDVEAWAKANKNLKARGSERKGIGNYEAREQGRQAGYKVRMAAAKGNLT